MIGVGERREGGGILITKLNLEHKDIESTPFCERENTNLI